MLYDQFGNTSVCFKWAILLLINYKAVVHIVMHSSGNNREIRRSLKHCIQNFKATLKKMKI